MPKPCGRCARSPAADHRRAGPRRPQDIEEAARALKPAERRASTPSSRPPICTRPKLRITREKCLELAVGGGSPARQFTDDVEFSAEDATRSDRDFLCRVIEAVIHEGATTVNLPDTVGYATSDETREFFHGVRTGPERGQRHLQRALS